LPLSSILRLPGGDCFCRWTFLRLEFGAEKLVYPVECHDAGCGAQVGGQSSGGAART
jgi:hypothetical protein